MLTMHANPSNRLLFEEKGCAQTKRARTEVRAKGAYLR